MSLPELVIVGDEAFTEAEWSAEQRRKQAQRSYERAYRKRRYHADPEYRARHLAYQAEYRRGWRPHLVGSLHDLSCTGPTREKGCKCDKIRCYDKPR